MERAASELLRAIRGARSQAAFSRRLGYRGNPVADWEGGRRFPTAAETFRACGRAGIDAAAAVARFHPTAAPAFGSGGAASIAKWLDELRGSAHLRAIAARAGRSRFAVSRWLSGKGNPRLPDFLRLVEASTGRASDLVAELVPIERIPSMLAAHVTRLRAKQLAFEEPWTEAIVRLVETRAHEELPRHDSAWFASRLGVDVATVDRCLKLLEQTKVVRKRGARARYEVSGDLTVDTHAAPEAVRGLKGHWADVARRRMPSPGDGDIFSYNVMSLSSEDLERVRQLLRHTFREIRSIVAATKAIDTAALLNLQLLEWDVRSKH